MPFNKENIDNSSYWEIFQIWEYIRYVFNPNLDVCVCVGGGGNFFPVLVFS